MDIFDFQNRMAQVRKQARAPATPRRTAAARAAEAQTVSQLTARIDQAIRHGLPASVLVKGEVSNFRNHTASGHLYFTLKDPQACIDCVMFRSDAARLKFTPQDGLELIASGRVGVFPQRGRYQLYVTSLQPVGQGALELAFQQLRARLQAEGLFAAEGKRPLPKYPRRIVLITSRETAALQDMLKVLRRYPWVSVLLFHVPVQGGGAAAQIADAIAQVNREGHCGLPAGETPDSATAGRPADAARADLILLARGGGSLEDLWAFNEEAVARAVAASQLPVITGIGHEADVTIADLAADYHAHTPTEAAQVAMTHWRVVRDLIDTAGIRLRRGLRAVVEQSRQRLLAMERHAIFRRPLERVNLLRQLLDHRQAALGHAMGGRLHEGQARLSRLSGRLAEMHPRHIVRLRRRELEMLKTRLDRVAASAQHQRRRELQALTNHLNAIGPEQVLRRGYSITILKKGGAVVRQAAQIKGGERMITRLADGQVESIAEDPVQLPLFE